MTAHAPRAQFIETSAGNLPASVAALTLPGAPPVAKIARSKPTVSPPAGISLSARTQHWLSLIVPPLIVVAIMLTVWELASSGPKSSLPSPSRIWTEAKDLIVDPFFVTGPQDIGLGWRVLTSLQRVAVGYGLAAIVGIMVGVLIGQSVWAMRGLDPVFQVLRTISPLAWLPISLAAFVMRTPPPSS